MYHPYNLELWRVPKLRKIFGCCVVEESRTRHHPWRHTTAVQYAMGTLQGDNGTIANSYIDLFRLAPELASYELITGVAGQRTKAAGLRTEGV